MTGSSKRNSSGESTDTATHNGDSELLEIRGQEGRVGGGIHETVWVVAVKCVGMRGPYQQALYMSGGGTPNQKSNSRNWRMY